MARSKAITPARVEEILSENALDAAYAIYRRIEDSRTARWPGDGEQYEEVTIFDIVGKLQRYGSISAPQMNFLRTLLGKIASRATVAAERAALKAAAADVPVGRVEIEGVVLTTKLKDSAFHRGGTLKMLVAHDSGWKVWGTVPSSIGSIVKGERVAFTATVEASSDDPKFGFFSRPVNARRLEAEAAPVEQAVGGSWKPEADHHFTPGFYTTPRAAASDGPPVAVDKDWAAL